MGTKLNKELDFKQRKFLRVIKKNLNDEDILTIFEIARLVLSDVEATANDDYISEQIDLSNKEIDKLREKIEFIMKKNIKKIN